MHLTSPDLSTLDYSVLMDISTPTPSITLSNLSTMINPGNLKWVFEIYAPSGTTVYKGNFTTPDVTGNWVTPFVQNGGMPLPMGIPELGNYTLVVRVRDVNATEFVLQKQVNICRPSGNNPKTAKNLFGMCVHSIVTRCQSSQIFAQDQTNYSYQGLAGTEVSNTFKLNFPSDDTGVVPSPFTINDFSSALIPITTSGDGYQSFQTAVWRYDFSDSVSVQVKYLGRSSFAVHCNLDLGLLGCEIQKLVAQLEKGSADEQSDGEAKLKLINPKFGLAITGVLYPQSCIDPWALVEDIKRIGGFDCDCACSSGIAAGAAISGAGPLSFVTNPSGDITATFSIVGSTVTLNIADITYVLRMDVGYSGTAFSIGVSNNGTTKTYSLKVDETLLAAELLTVIQNNVSLMNQLVTMVTTNSGKVSVDPMCLADTLGVSAGRVCDYIFSVAFPAAGTYLIDSLYYLDDAGGTVLVILNFAFDQTNAAALQTKLNANNLLGQNFQVTFDAGTRTLTVSTLGNKNQLTKMTYVSGGNAIAFDLQKKNCTGVTSFATPVLLQGMITYLCNIAGHVITSGCSFDISVLVALAGQIQTVTAKADDSYCQVMDKLITSYNGLVKIVQAIKEVNAVNINTLFNNDISVIEDHDRLYGIFNSVPGRVSMQVLVDAVIAQLKGVKSTDFCAALAVCGNKSVCDPVSAASVVYDSTAQTLTLTITNNGSLKYRVAYRSFKSTAYGPLTGPWAGTTDINASAGATTTQVWSNVSPNAWQAQIQSICPSGMSTAYVTDASLGCIAPGSFSVTEDGNNFTITWGGIPGNAPKVRLSIAYPNGGSLLQNYLANASPLVLPIPSGVSGDFVFMLSSACDETNAWYSDYTKALTVNVPAASSCPRPASLDVTALTSNSFTVVMTKPAGANAPVAYTLRYYDSAGAHYSTSNSAGNTVFWTISGLAPQTVYRFDIVSECSDGSESDPLPGGYLATLPSGSVNSSIHNASPATDVVQPLQVSVNHILSYIKYDGLAHGVTDNNMSIPNWTGASVRVKACGMIIATASIVSNGNTYTPAYIDTDGAAVFNNINIQNGMQVTFSN